MGQSIENPRIVQIYSDAPLKLLGVTAIQDTLLRVIQSNNCMQIYFAALNGALLIPGYFCQGIKSAPFSCCAGLAAKEMCMNSEGSNAVQR